MNLITNTMNAYVAEVQDRLRAMGRPVIADMFKATYLNTIETTVKLDEHGAFVITGDIPAMWLRDSSAQVRHYLNLTAGDSAVRSLVTSLVKRQAYCILDDPYANAFNQTKKEGGHYADTTEFDNPMAWERKYEVDSLCSVLFIAYKFWKKVGRTSIFTPEFKKSMEIILNVWETEQYHAEKSDYYFRRDTDDETDTTRNGGKGFPVGYTGMTWSGFRPSDDSCVYNYLIPSEMYAVVTLGYAAEIATEIYKDEELAARCKKLAAEIDEGIKKFGIVEDPDFGKIYAYETDGLGNYILMDDANVPSLMSLPYIGYCDVNDPIYQNTRKFILSKKNPFYFEGKILKGIGSPHTPVNTVWPISLVMQGLTTDSKEEVEEILDMLVKSHADTFFMHESINVNDPYDFTRTWFAWANSIFSELVLKYAGFEI